MDLVALMLTMGMKSEDLHLKLKKFTPNHLTCLIKLMLRLEYIKHSDLNNFKIQRTAPTWSNLKIHCNWLSQIQVKKGTNPINKNRPKEIQIPLLHKILYPTKKHLLLSSKLPWKMSVNLYKNNSSEQTNFFKLVSKLKHMVSLRCWFTNRTSLLSIHLEICNILQPMRIFNPSLKHLVGLLNSIIQNLLARPRWFLIMEIRWVPRIKWIYKCNLNRFKKKPKCKITN